MFAHVLNVSLPSLLRVGFFVFGFFFAGHVGSLKTQISQKLQKPKYLAKICTGIYEKKNICKRLGRGTLNTCAKFQGLISQKRRGHLTLKEIGVSCLSQPVRFCLFFFVLFHPPPETLAENFPSLPKTYQIYVLFTLNRVHIILIESIVSSRQL